MDYLQYEKWEKLYSMRLQEVLNLIINGLPSILKNGMSAKELQSKF